MRFILAAIIILMISVPAHCREREYQKAWCDAHSGSMEYRLPDATRVDCLTETHAVEVDFGRKWAEAIGQSLYYSSCTGKRAGIVLILKDDGELRFLRRLEETISSAALNIDVWILNTTDSK